MISLRVAISGPRPKVALRRLGAGGIDASQALIRETKIWMDGAHTRASIYDRDRLLAGNVVAGPAIVVEMDSTTLVLPGHAATVHASGSLLIRPMED